MNDVKIVDLAKFPSENPNPILRVSKDKIIYVNKAGSQLFNVQADDPIPEVLLEEIKKVLRNDSTFSFESEFGNQIFIFNIVPIEDKDYVNIYGMNITERKKAEEEIRLHSEIMINITEGIYLTRLEDGIIVYTNPRFDKMFGYNPDEMIGQYVTIVNAPTNKTPEETKEDIVGILKDTGEWHGEVENIKKDGTLFWCYANVSIFNHPEHGEVIVSVHTDITGRKKIEDELKKSEEIILETYERAEIYKDLFAHDISNILQNIKSSIGLLSMWQKNPQNPQTLNEVISIVDHQVFRGAKLITNIRKLSEIGETSELISADPFSKLNEAIQFIKKSYSDKQIEIEITSQLKEIKILANDLLLDIYENLMINSVKYNKNPTIKIQIKLSKTREDNLNYLKLEFKDNGIGISDSMKEGIFNGTTKREDKSKGMGLGLLLVRKIILSYNGKIWVEDKVDGDYSQGSNFVILLLEVN
ncbi:hypothetical protein LCGC14_0766470 [marine sediment metagenome]|uniref:histidine kinase n=1 Tax=marine sediment metagenome TaxID=412755 RepID=A0A0F9QJD6_9ZZZZ|nr:MAG: Signal transduction histidine kinase [Candidatus Lokiarchaeum sp. GC14_75]